MSRSRSSQISLDATLYYHCVNRCVCRAFLCGDDQKFWVENRIFELQSIFSIDICAFAIMSYHYHLVLYVDEESAKSWSTREIVERWHRIFKGVKACLLLTCKRSVLWGKNGGFV